MRKIDPWIVVLILVLFMLSSRLGMDGYELEFFISAHNLVHGNGLHMSSEFKGMAGILPLSDDRIVYPRHGLLQVFLEAPLYILGDLIDPDSKMTLRPGQTPLPRGPLIAVSFLNPLLMTGIALLMALIVMQLGMSSETAHRLMVIFATATMAWPYAVIGMEPLQTFTILLALWGFLSVSSTSRMPGLVAGCIGIMAAPLHKHYSLVFVLPLVIFGTWMISRNHPRSRLHTILPFFAGFAGCMLWYLQDAVKNSAGTDMYTAGFLDQINLSCAVESFWGWILSPGKGLMIYNPILLWAFSGFPALWKTRRDVTLAIAALIGVNLLVIVPWDFALVEETWGPRYIFSIVPLMMILGVSSLTSTKRSLIMKALFVLTVIISILIQIPACMYSGHIGYEIALSAGAAHLSAVVFVPSLSPIRTVSLLSFNHLISGFGYDSIPFSWVYYEKMPGVGGKLQSRSFSISGYDKPNAVPFLIESHLRKQGTKCHSGWIMLSWLAVISLIVGVLYWRGFRPLKNAV